MESGDQRFLCLASREKGHDFLRECAELGVKTTLLTLESLRETWPSGISDDLICIPENLTRQQLINTVSYKAREQRFDRVIALDEADQESAAALREHMCLPGLNLSTAAQYSDRLAMRTSAQEMGLRVTPFCRVLNYDEVRSFIEQVPAPWLLKPRTPVVGRSLRHIDDSGQLWSALEELGDLQSHFVLEKFIPGDIFHVDAILHHGRVVFSIVHQNGRPPMQERPDGGILTTRTVDRASRDWLELSALNSSLVPNLGMKYGLTQARFVRSQEDGEYYFLEIAARVGSLHVVDLIEAATTVNLWHEWARLEVANLRNDHYAEPKYRELYAGSILCNAVLEENDINQFKAPEIVKHFCRSREAGLIIRSAVHLRIKDLIDQYGPEFSTKFIVGRQDGHVAQPVA
ncbi:MAG: ATPase [Acidobacteriota bacterium]|nr:ATPase [Acidobacteriota bacterium]